MNCPGPTGPGPGAPELRNPEAMTKLLAERSTPEAQKSATGVFGGRDPRKVSAACAGDVRDATAIAAETVGPSLQVIQAR